MPKARSLRSLAISTSTVTPPRRNSTATTNSPPSPTFSEATNASAMNFGEHGPSKIITRADLKQSTQAYESLLNAAASYEVAMQSMSQATAALAHALQNCSALKGPTYEQGTRLQAASGLHHLIGNHWAVLAETLQNNFEKPLRQHLDTYRSTVQERSASYERTLKEKSKIIHDLEKRNFNVRKGERNMQTFREALTSLQRHVDSLDELKAEHYEQIVEHEQQVWEGVQGKVCLLVRSTMDVFERFTAKASDPILEPMLREIPDPFNEFGSPPAEDAIFSILPPLSIMAPSPSLSQSSSHSGTPSHDILTPFTPSSSSTSAAAPTTTSSYAGASFAGFASNSWTGGSATQSPQRYTAADEWADAHSPPVSPSPPRSPSPKSRPSSPPNSKGHSRSESKLRSVLSVIDETHGGTVKESTSREGLETVERDARGGWAIRGAGFPYAGAGADTTPRASTFYGEDEPHEQPEAVGVTS
ncbi:hypothetical protein PENSPDRAFT_743995 [Peniophora sp. CONT]|nr:hypothetical protein PENSPDRAFT_743995 [Peniophora sp. CONT]